MGLFGIWIFMYLPEKKMVNLIRRFWIDSFIKSLLLAYFYCLCRFADLELTVLRIRHVAFDIKIFWNPFRNTTVLLLVSFFCNLILGKIPNDLKSIKFWMSKFKLVMKETLLLSTLLISFSTLGSLLDAQLNVYSTLIFGWSHWLFGGINLENNFLCTTNT